MRKVRHRETKEGIQGDTDSWMLEQGLCPGTPDSSAFALNFFKLISYFAGAHVRYVLKKFRMN